MFSELLASYNMSATCPKYSMLIEKDKLTMWSIAAVIDYTSFNLGGDRDLIQVLGKGITRSANH